MSNFTPTDAPQAPHAQRMARPDGWMLMRLPERMRDDDFLVRFVTMFQEIAESYAAHADQLEHVFDPAVAPEAMVRLMGEWIGVDMIDETLPVEVQRRIVLGMADIPRWRGTRRGLVLLLELVCGGNVEVHDSGGVYSEADAPGRPGHIHISVESSGWMSEAHLLETIRRELPATVTFELDIGDTRWWP